MPLPLDPPPRRRPDVAGWLLVLTGVVVVALLFGTLLLGTLLATWG